MLHSENAFRSTNNEGENETAIANPERGGRSRTGVGASRGRSADGIIETRSVAVGEEQEGVC